MLYTLAELGATFAEEVLVLYIIMLIAGRRWNSYVKNTICILFVSLIMTALVHICNQIQAFSFATIYIAFICWIFETKLITTGNIKLRIMSALLAVFLCHTIDYIFSFSIALIYGESENIYESFAEIMSPGTMRVMLLILSKLILLLIVILLRSLFKRLRDISNKTQVFLILLFAVSYVVVSLLLNMIITDSSYILQIAVIISWVFILFCILAVVYASVINIRYEREKAEKRIEETANHLIHRNYMQLSGYVKDASTHIHDFKNHLRILQELTQDNKIAQEYMQEIMESLSSMYKLCRSGNEYIDAVMNCKLHEAQNYNIKMEYIFQLVGDLPFSAVDICTILANQIDNAIEACRKIENTKERFIQVSIIQKHAFIFFTVENSIIPGSVTDVENLVSSKNIDDGMRHGVGIHNIRLAAEKYNGSLKCTVTENTFISTAMLQIEK